MPRLRVLNLRNNRMGRLHETNFRNLRSNIAILDVDGNPIDCSCEMLWLRAWLQETNAANGPVSEPTECDSNFVTLPHVSLNSHLSS